MPVMRIFNGKKNAEKILADLKKKISQQKTRPKLAIILVGEDPASKLYIRRKKEAGKKVGIKVRVWRFRAKTTQQAVIKKIENLNKNPEINGILLQLPLPGGFNTDKIISTINPKKDVDGFHKLNRKLLKKGKPYFWPVLPQAIFLALKKAISNLREKKIIALVNSEIFGQTLKDFLKRKEIKISYFLKKKLSSQEIKSKLKSAEVVIVAVGCPKLIKKDMIKDKAIVIDAGITLKGKRKLVGDVDQKSVSSQASFLTPVPRGIGPLNVALLLKNVFVSELKFRYNTEGVGGDWVSPRGGKIGAKRRKKPKVS